MATLIGPFVSRTALEIILKEVCVDSFHCFLDECEVWNSLQIESVKEGGVEGDRIVVVFYRAGVSRKYISQIEALMDLL